MSNTSGQAASSAGDHTYKAVQANFSKLIMIMNDVMQAVERLRIERKTDAIYAQKVVTDIENAGVDKRFVEMTQEVVKALDGAFIQSGKVMAATKELSDLAHEKKKTHQRYEGLDTVRSGRRERTPRPGFFAN